MDLTRVIDCMGANLAAVDPPPGVLMAGYATGSGDVPWSDAQWAAHPGAVRFDQSPIDTPADETADVIDVEPQAGTIADVPGWVHGAWTSWRTGRRPGQRKPTVYVEESELTPVANTLDAAGITNGVNLWLSKPMSEQEATDILARSGGPFPIIGVQYAFQSLFDVSLVLTSWLDDMSKAPVTTPVKEQYQSGWRFCHKCQGLFWGPGQSISVCPRGAQHDETGSHVYTLGFTL